MVARIKAAIVILGLIKHPTVYPPSLQISEKEKGQLKKILRHY